MMNINYYIASMLLWQYVYVGDLVYATHYPRLSFFEINFKRIPNEIENWIDAFEDLEAEQEEYKAWQALISITK